MSILFLAIPDEAGKLSENTLQSLATARRVAGELNTPLCVGLIGGGFQKAADSISSAATTFMAVEKADGCFATDTAACTALIKQSGAEFVFAPAELRFKKALPAAAFRAGGVADTQIGAVKGASGALEVERWYYRQRIKGAFSRTRRPWCLLLEAGIDAPYSGSAVAVDVKLVTPEGYESKSKICGVESPSGDARTIRPEAKLLFVAGAGWTKKQANPANDAKKAGELILDFLNKSKASLGSSKSLVDQGTEGDAVLPFMSHLNQVGQTGATPRHQKGLSTCCHGEEPHVVGWRFIAERRAVNLNENCGWAHGKADVLYVADAFEVMEELNKLV